MTTQADFEARYHALERSFRSDADERSSLECRDCRGCRACTFCRSSERLISCHFCVECSDCFRCHHCRRSRRLYHAQHCLESEDCYESAYLVRCRGLVRASYCFGCVGLQDVDFHILNEPVERSEYFARTAELSRLLNLR